MGESFWIAVAGLVATGIATVCGMLGVVFLQNKAASRRAEAERQHQTEVLQRERLWSVKEEGLEAIAEFIRMSAKALTQYRRPRGKMSDEQWAELRIFRARHDTVETEALISGAAIGAGERVESIIIDVSEKLTNAAVAQAESKDMSIDAYGSVLNSMSELKNAYMKMKAKV